MTKFSPFFYVLCFLFFGLGPRVAGQGNAWHVSPHGDDGHAGNDSAPFRTIAKAVSEAMPGDTVWLHAGEYATLSAVRSGTATDPIRFRALLEEGRPVRAVLSAFDPMTPGANGFGDWELHAGAIWKITVPSGWGFQPGGNLVRAEGAALRPARWPDAAGAVDFDRRHMREAQSGALDLASRGTQPPYSPDDFYTGSYVDPGLTDFADGSWAGAHIDLCAGHNWWPKSGVVTGNAGETLHFRFRFAENWEAVIDTPKEGDRFALWGHLQALTSPGEFFLDVHGINGPARTLYLWMPEGDSPVGKTVELLRRSRGLDLGNFAHLHVRDLHVLGAVYAGPNAHNLLLDGLEVAYGGMNRNLLFWSNRTAVELRGTAHIFRNGHVRQGWGTGIMPFGEDHLIENNVVHGTFSHPLSLAGARNGVIRRNSVFHGGDTGVDIGGKGLLIEYNHVSHAGMRITDIALMNTWNAGDLEGTELRYNWVHSNQAPWDPSRSWWGGQGIRLDSGHAPVGVYNARIHHNVVWNTSADSAISIWRLAEDTPGHGDAQVLVAQNTMDKALVLAGSGDASGTEYRRNISERWNDIGQGFSGAEVSENHVTQFALPGNLTGNPGFVSPANRNLTLRADAQTRDHGDPIPGVTEAGPYAYLGAYNPDRVPWRPGAYLRPKDLPELQAEWAVNSFGQFRVHLFGGPVGRTFPEEVRLRVGGREATLHAIRSHWQTREEAAWFDLDPDGLPVDAPVEISPGGDAPWVTLNQQTLELSPPEIPFLETEVHPAEGGTRVQVQTKNLQGQPAIRVPVQLDPLLPGDLQVHPVPWVVDTRPWLEAGMAADARDLRFFASDGETPIRFHIESGWGQANTLIWLLEGESIARSFVSFESLASLYVSWGDPLRESADEPGLLSDAYPLLQSAEHLLDLRAGILSGLLEAEAAVAVWPDQSSHAHPVIAPASENRPQFVPDGMGGLPSLRFDGLGNFMDVNGAEGLGIGAGRTFVVYRNPEPGDTAWQRLLSARNNPDQLDYEGGVFEMPENGENGEILASQTPVLRDRGQGANASRENFRIARRSLSSHETFRGEIAEIQVFSRSLTHEEQRDLRHMLRRKYNIEPRPGGTPDLAEAIGPIRVWVNNEPATGVLLRVDGQLSFDIPQYTGEGPLPTLVDLRVEMPGQDDLLLEGAVEYLPFHASITFSGLNPVYNGTPQSPGIATDPPGLEVLLQFNGEASLPVAAGSYTLEADVQSPLYAGFVEDLFVLHPAPLLLAGAELGKAEGQVDPDFPWTILEGGLFGEDAPEGALSRVQGETPGRYPLTLGSLNFGPNYQPVLQPVDFIIHHPVNTLLYGGDHPIPWRTSDNQHALVDTVIDPLLNPESPHEVLRFRVENPEEVHKDDYLYLQLDPPVDLALGQTLRVTYALRIDGGPPRADASRTGVAFGYRSTGNSPWAHGDNFEYAFQTSYGHSDALGSLHKSQGVQFLNHGPLLQSGLRSVDLQNEPGTVRFEISRTAPQTAMVLAQLNGLPSDTFEDEDATHWQFTHLFLRFRRRTTEPLETFHLHDLRVKVLSNGQGPQIQSGPGLLTSPVFRYQIETSSDLTDETGWQPSGDWQIGTGAWWTFPTLQGLSGAPKFLRVIQQPAISDE